MKYGKSFPTDADIANAVPCSFIVENQDIDLELLADSVDAIEDNEPVYVDELPDGNPYFVTSNGLPTFGTGQRNVSKRPLGQRGVVEYSVVEGIMTAPSTSHSSHSRVNSSVSLPRNIPQMPVFKGIIPEHRDHHPILGAIEACVARPVSKKERLESAGARASLEKEWSRLRKIDTWDESRVREWSDVAAEARKSRLKVHVGRIFDICVEKGSELPLGDPARKFKGRVVFQGNQVKDENWEVAMFQDLSSCPATMEAGKACDLVGSLDGHDIQQSDAEQAYTQSKLGGDPTWVRLPREQWPESWKNMRPCLSSYPCPLWTS